MPSDELSPEQSNQSEPPQAMNAVVSSPLPSSINKPLVTVGLIVLLVVIGLGAYIASHSSKNGNTTSVSASNPIKKIAPAQVSITSTGFVPATITVKVGQAVSWTNQDNAPHWVASDPYPTDNALIGFNAKQNLSLNDRFSYIFNKAGTFTYHDNSNPYTMKGTVVVKQ